MNDRCDAVSARPRDYSTEDASCTPTREESATVSTNARQEAEREAELRRNQYFASGSDEGGRSKRASSDTGAVETSTPDDKILRIINNAKKYDPPIESDPLGNALIGVAAGGIVGGVESGAGKVGLAGARGMFLQPASRALVKGVVVGEDTGGAAVLNGAAAGAAKSAVKSLRNAAILEGAPMVANALISGSAKPTEPQAAPTAPAPATTSARSPGVVGQSSKNGASVPVAEPTHSQGPRIPEVLGAAPVRIQG